MRLTVPPPILTSPTLWTLIGLAVGLYLFYRGFALLRRQRLILDTPRSTARGAALGVVEVSGRAVGPYTVISPVSALNCYYYRATAWQNESRNWKKAAEESLCAPFFVDDSTGLILIHPRGAEFDLSPTFSQEYGPQSSEFIPDYLEHFLHRHGVSREYPLKIEEICILPDDRLFVLGTLQENDRAEKAAFISPEAADLQRRGMVEFLDPTAARELTSAQTPYTTEPFELEPRTVLAEGAPGDPFLISWRSEREVVLGLQWKALVYIWIGPIVTLACLWELIAQGR